MSFAAEGSAKPANYKRAASVSRPGSHTAAIRIAVAGFELLGLLAGEWMLIWAIHATNYGGGDGKTA